MFASCGFFFIVASGLSFANGCSADRLHSSDHLIQFGSLGGDSRKIRSSLHLIWLACVWVLPEGNERSHFFFKKNWHYIDYLIKWTPIFLVVENKNKNFAFDILSPVDKLPPLLLDGDLVCLLAGVLLFFLGAWFVFYRVITVES